MIAPQQTAGGEPPAVAVSEWVDWAERGDDPLYRVVIWPNRSLTPGVRRTVLTVASVGLAVPLGPALGTPVFWGLLPFLAGALGLLWLGLRRSDRDGRLVEELTLWPDEIRVERREPQGRIRRWAADPYWVRLHLREGLKVDHYLTLKGGGREIELGAFLSPEERVSLADELESQIARAIRA